MTETAQNVSSVTSSTGTPITHSPTLRTVHRPRSVYYKTKKCRFEYISSNYEENIPGPCVFGIRCNFAHSEKEKREPPSEERVQPLSEERAKLHRILVRTTSPPLLLKEDFPPLLPRGARWADHTENNTVVDDGPLQAAVEAVQSAAHARGVPVADLFLASPSGLEKYTTVQLINEVTARLAREAPGLGIRLERN